MTLAVCTSTHAAPKTDKPFGNTLGMTFVPVPGTKVQFCIWETLVKDYSAYAAGNAGVDESWKYLSDFDNSFRPTRW